MEKYLEQGYVAVQRAAHRLIANQKTHSFAALTRSFSDTFRLVNKNRTRALSMK